MLNDAIAVLDNAFAVPNDALDELRLFATAGVKPERFACRLELLASQNVQESTKVQRSLSHNRVDVGIRGPSIGHVQLEALGEFREAVTRELLQDGATRTWGEANH